MKKFISISLCIAIFWGMTNLAGYSVTTSSERGSISVSISENVELPADVAEISFAIQTYDTKSMQKATLTNKEISDNVFSQLKSMIDTKNGDYIKTSNYSAQPIYSYNSSKKSFERYEVSNRIIVHTKSINKVGNMIDNAISAGATNVDNLTFSLSNYDSQCGELLSLATQKAKKRADLIAKSISAAIIGINSINTTCSANNYNPPRLYMAKNMISDVAEDTALGRGTTISNGVIKVYANVNASFYVK